MEQQKKQCESLKSEVATEHAARREAEQALEALRVQLGQAQADAAAHLLAREKESLNLEAARREVDDLRRIVTQIRSICVPPPDQTTSTGGPT